MTTIGLILVIVIIGLVCWLVPGIPTVLRNLLIAVGVIIFVLWLLGIFGVLDLGFRSSPVIEHPVIVR